MHGAGCHPQNTLVVLRAPPSPCGTHDGLETVSKRWLLSIPGCSLASDFEIENKKQLTALTAFSILSNMKATLCEGTLVGGRYRIIRCIAKGGMGEVYEAMHIETRRHRALKIMHAHLFESDEMRERFKREACVTADVNSEHLVEVLDAGVDETCEAPYLVMELLRGEDLHSMVTKRGPLPYAEVILYLRQVATALDDMHERHIVHRDLKPENLFVTRRADGSPLVKILDFGVAKLVADGKSNVLGTQALGTPMFMAPEQLMPGAKLSPATDIYAFGLVAFSLLTGRPYWELESVAAGGLIPFVVLAVQGPKVPGVHRAAEYGISLPAGFNAWFARCTSVVPRDRFPCATVSVAELSQIFERKPAPRQAERRMPLGSVILIFGVMLGFGMMIGTLWLLLSSNRKKPMETTLPGPQTPLAEIAVSSPTSAASTAESPMAEPSKLAITTEARPTEASPPASAEKAIKQKSTTKPSSIQRPRTSKRHDDGIIEIPALPQE